MKFKYKKYSAGILRPVIPIGITYHDRSLSYEVLVDSGADMCIFDAELADILGIAVMEGRKSEVSGVTGEIESFYIHRIGVNVGGWEYSLEAGFLPNIANTAYGIVGQNGFFDLFIVSLDLLKGEIELKERMRSSKKLILKRNV